MSELAFKWKLLMDNTTFVETNVEIVDGWQCLKTGAVKLTLKSSISFQIPYSIY